MNRRLFVGQIVAGASLFSVPSILFARSASSLPSNFAATNATKRAVEWIQNGSLGSLQHITLSHVYSPERTSLAALLTIVQQDIAKVNKLLGTDFTVTDQGLLKGNSFEHGTYSTQLEKAGVKITWQGLARIGVEAKKPATRLRVFGSKGIIQTSPDGNDYQLMNW